MQKHRVLWLDFIKGLCIFMVVFYHAIYFSGKSNFDNSNIEILFKYIFDIIMMPCFFAVSGYLYNSVNTLREYIILIYKKCSSFIIPYIIFYLIFSINYTNNHIYIIPNINLKNIFMQPDGDLWFLEVLLFIFLFIGILNLCHMHEVSAFCVSLLILIVFLILIAPYLPHVHFLLQIFNIIFFICGQIIKDHIYFIKRHDIVILILFILSFILMFLTKPFSYDAQFISLNTLIPKLLSVFMVFSIASNMSSNTKYFFVFSKIGRCTLIIYLVHFIPVLILNRLLSSVTKYLFFNSLIVLVISWFISVFICYLTHKSRILNFIFYPRKYITKWLSKSTFGKAFFHYINLRRN